MIWAVAAAGCDSGGGSDEASSSSSGLASSSEAGESPTEQESASDSISGSGESGAPVNACESLGGVELSSFEMSFEQHTVMAEDQPTSPVDPPCLYSTVDGFELWVQWGTSSSMRVSVPSAGTYDLATDFAQSETGDQSAVKLSYDYTEGTQSNVYDPSYQDGEGSMQVTAWPETAGDPIALSAQGTIAGSGGWAFSFTLDADPI